MSLWHKPIELVTFDDIEAFCQQGHAEGPHSTTRPRFLANCTNSLPRSPIRWAASSFSGSKPTRSPTNRCGRQKA